MCNTTPYKYRFDCVLLVYLQSLFHNMTLRKRESWQSANAKQTVTDHDFWKSICVLDIYYIMIIKLVLLEAINYPSSSFKFSSIFQSLAVINVKPIGWLSHARVACLTFQHRVVSHLIMWHVTIRLLKCDWVLQHHTSSMKYSIRSPVMPCDSLWVF